MYDGVMNDVKRRWLIDGWNWWKYNHRYDFIKSVRLTFRSEIWIHFRDIYAWFWLKWNWIKRRYMPWTQCSKMMREIKESKEKL